MIARTIGFHFLERIAAEALLVRARRQRPGHYDGVMSAVILGSIVALPALAAVFAVWLITGRGPWLRTQIWGLGGPRQRPPEIRRPRERR